MTSSTVPSLTSSALSLLGYRRTGKPLDHIYQYYPLCSEHFSQLSPHLLERSIRTVYYSFRLNIAFIPHPPCLGALPFLITQNLPATSVLSPFSVAQPNLHYGRLTFHPGLPSSGVPGLCYRAQLMCAGDWTQDHMHARQTNNWAPSSAPQHSPSHFLFLWSPLCKYYYGPTWQMKKPTLMLFVPSQMEVEPVLILTLPELLDGNPHPLTKHKRNLVSDNINSCETFDILYYKCFNFTNSRKHQITQNIYYQG